MNSFNVRTKIFAFIVILFFAFTVSFILNEKISLRHEKGSEKCSFDCGFQSVDTYDQSIYYLGFPFTHTTFERTSISGNQPDEDIVINTTFYKVNDIKKEYEPVESHSYVKLNNYVLIILPFALISMFLLFFARNKK